MKSLVSLGIALVLAAAATPARAVDTDWLFSFGAAGAGDGQFNSPTEIAIGPTGSVYVLDAGNGRIQKFDAEGNYLTQWTSARPFQGAMNSIAATSDGLVYVQATYYVTKYDGDGNYIQYFGPLGGSSAGSHHITGDRAGNFYLQYWINGFSQVSRFVSQPGVVLLQGAGGFGSGGGTLGRIAVAPSGEIYVPDVDPFTQARTIGRRTAAGAVIVQWPEVAPVIDATCDLEGNLYACEFGSNLVRVYDPAGGTLATIGGTGSAPGQFLRPWDVAVGPDGRIYVVDRDNHRVQVFGHGATPATPATWGRVKAQYR